MNVEFEFVDGPRLTRAAAGVDMFFEPPYHAYWEESTQENVMECVKWLKEYLEQNGPYDALMGFSQGSILIAATLLSYQAESKAPPFKTAFFFCGTAPLWAMEVLGFNVPETAWKRERASSIALAAQAESSAISEKRGDRWQGADAELLVPQAEAMAEVEGPYNITLPTVHVYGSKDPKYVGGLQLSSMCTEGNRQVYNHGGGHEIPRKADVTAHIADLIRDALEEAGVY